ncbi:MAG: potassium channel family protein [Candidatus Saliniplasma sp.]
MKKVEKDLIEMKNISELMLDLAYSSVLFQNRDIAEEVIELEARIDKLYEGILDKVLLNCKEGGDLRRERIVLKVADSIERFADAALDIADVVLRDIDLHPVVKRSMRESDEIMVRKKIQKGSYLDGKTLDGTRMETNIGMKIIAVRRSDKWAYGPKKDLSLKNGDIIFARGPEESEKVLDDWTIGKGKR